MKRVPLAELRASLGDVVHEVQHRRQRVKITRYGRTQAWLVSVEDAQKLGGGDDEPTHSWSSAAASASRKPGVRAPRDRTGLHVVERSRRRHLGTD